MSTFSTPCPSAGQPTLLEVLCGAANRSDRAHLYPLESYEVAATQGGPVRAYCGIVKYLPRGAEVHVVEHGEIGDEDCVTCVDVWLGREQVRL